MTVQEHLHRILPELRREQTTLRPVRQLLRLPGHHTAPKVQPILRTSPVRGIGTTSARLCQEFEDSANPISSRDSKKKEFIGELFRDGRAYATGPHTVLDHAYPSWAKDKFIPHGLYDLQRNVGHITLGFRHGTSQFACDSFRLW